MNGYRIMDSRTDASADQILSEHVAVFSTNDIKVPNGFGSRGLGRRYDTRPLKRLLIELGIPAASSIPLFQILQFDPEYGRLQCVKPAVVPAELVVIFFFLTIVAQHFQALCDVAVIRNDHSAVSKGPQIFPRIKA